MRNRRMITTISSLSMSVLEHLPEDDIKEVMEHAYRCLKPGGRFIITLDLFLKIRALQRS